eukprot:COSAG02_NODE_4009_length_5918_cov_10.500086_2_plen_106_part_00
MEILSADFPTHPVSSIPASMPGATSHCRLNLLRPDHTPLPTSWTRPPLVTSTRQDRHLLDCRSCRQLVHDRRRLIRRNCVGGLTLAQGPYARCQTTGRQVLRAAG